MGKNGIPQRKRLAAVFASFTILIMGTVSLFESMSIDYYSVLNTLQKVIPASIALGGLGWVMGMILDKPKRRSRRMGYNNLFMNEVLKNSIPSVPEETTEATEAVEEVDSSKTSE